MLEFQKVTATYKKNTGIFDISFELNAGEMIFLMGPTGAGKSTVLKAVYSAIKINTGKIIVDDKDLTKIKQYQIPFLRQNIGMIFQDFKLLNDRTVLENVALPLRIQGIPTQKIYEDVHSTLSKVGLSKLHNSYPLELSGGEQQRVCIARALVKKPKIILADEPTANLDYVNLQKICDFIVSIRKKYSSSFIIATHDERLCDLADKILYLDNGKLSERKKNQI